MTNKSSYHSFMLRLWQEGKNSKWRATLENPRTGERQGFPNLESLFAFLHTTIDEQTPPEETNDKLSKRKK